MGRPVPKEEVRRLLETLPDEVSYEDIQYHIYVQQKIEQALPLLSDKTSFPTKR